MKRFISLVLAFLLCLSLAASALADGEADVSGEPLVIEAEETDTESPAAEDAGPTEDPVPAGPAEPEPDGAPLPELFPRLAQAMRYVVRLSEEKPDLSDLDTPDAEPLLRAVLMLQGADPADNPPGPEPTATPEPTPAPAEPVLLAYVTDGGPVDDHALNQAAYEGMTAWIGEREGYELGVFEPKEGEEDSLAAFHRACDAGAKVVICVGGGHYDAIEQAARDYPNTRFVILDSETGDAVPMNLAGVTFAVEQSGYAAGYAAVMDGYTKLGFLGAFSFIPDICLYGWGYVQGVMAAASEKDVHVDMLYTYGVGFAPSDEAKAQAMDWYNAGTEVIFACAGGANQSVGEATDACHKKMIGVDVAPGEEFSSLLTSALKDVRGAAERMLEKACGSDWDSVAGVTARLSAAEGMDLLPTEPWVMERFTKEQYTALLGELKTGVRTVDGRCPEDMTALSNTNVTIRDRLGEPTTAELVDKAFIDPVGNSWGKYDSLIDEIKAESDPAKRAELMHEAEDILMATGCVIPIYYYNDVFLQKDYVSGVYTTPYGNKYFMYADLANGADSLRINLASEPYTLDPALNSSVDGACLAVNSFSGLYTYDADGHTVPACAESYAVSADGLTYTVTLKEGLRWSDGSDLTAADFEYSWKRAASEETAADYGYIFAGFDGYPNDLNVTAADARTLRFVLSEPCAYMEDLMAFPTFYPVKRSAVEADPDGWCAEAGFVSNGAYVCTGWDHDESMTYEKNPYWYNADAVTVEKLEFMLSADDTAIFAAYNAGDIDFADSVPTDEVASLLDNPEFNTVDELGTYYVAFNAKSSVFEGKTPEQAACMRRAFSLLIDRDYICKNIGRVGQVAANSFIPLGMADGNGGVFESDPAGRGYYDPYAINNDRAGTTARAVELLKAAGYKFNEDGTLSDETPIRLTYLTNWGSGHIAIAESIRQDLAAVGIELTVQTQDWNVFLEECRAGNFDFAREGWISDFNDPINMLEVWITDSGYNDCQFGR